MDLIDAVEAEDINQVNQLLLNVQINVDVTNEAGDTPLLLAARLWNVEIGTRLVRGGADINHANNAGITPLITAIIHRRKEFVVLLLEREDINVNAQARCGRHGFISSCK